MDSEKAVLLATGSVFFPAALVVSKRIIKHFLVCSQSDAIIAGTRLVSALQSVLASVAGFVIVSSCSDLVHDRHFLADAYVLFATPYFLYDIIAMFLCHRAKGRGAGPGGTCSDLIGYLQKEALLVAHHLFIAVFCFPLTVFYRGPRGDYFVGLLLLPELSTPLLCLGKLLLQFHLQDSVWFKVNALLTITTFFCCRVLLFPYMYYSYSRYSGLPLLSVLSSAPWQCNVGAALLWSLQLYWFVLLCRAAVRSVTRGGRHTHTETYRHPYDRIETYRHPYDRIETYRHPYDRIETYRHPYDRIETYRHPYDRIETYRHPYDRIETYRHPYDRIETYRHPYDRIETYRHPYDRIETYRHPYDRIETYRHPYDRIETYRHPYDRIETYRHPYDRIETYRHPYDRIETYRHPYDRIETYRHPYDRIETYRHPYDRIETGILLPAHEAPPTSKLW
uniref:TLC domain-containing protein n=1 Tax=Knipowitschia caucasica TaxID=637954 RepID=A0AAV2KQ17_KNICA